MDITLTYLEQALGYTFQKLELLVQALTHRSVMNESPELGTQHNERLEFLGDAVVDLSVGHQLMERLPQAREGELSKLRAMVVRTGSLALAAEHLDLGAYLRLGRGEEQTNGRKKSSILADAFEAVIGAIFLDAGFSQADLVIRRLLGPFITVAVEGALDRDHKTRLQEFSQAHWHTMPHYQVIEDYGPDHAKTFVVAVYLEGKELARASGPSKKMAEQQAAQLALNELTATSAENSLDKK
jgi:ribonuclease-3